MLKQPSLSTESLHWLLMAQLLVVLPHLLHIPLWVLGLELGCLGWRLLILQGRLAYPSTLLKVLLITGVCAAIYASRGQFVGLDAGVVLLICALVLKTLEMRTRRDALVVIFLGFFSVVTGYLFEDGLLAALYSLLPITALVAALISLQSLPHWSTKQRIKLALRLLGQSIPLMLVLFVFFPRLDPLWSLPQADERRISGLSDRLVPETMGELTRSSEVAFRASFEGSQPSPEQLYWRAITFDYFDGAVWLKAGAALQPTAPEWPRQGKTLSYQLILQPSAQPWLIALDIPVLEQGPAFSRMMGDFHLEQPEPASRPLLYRVSSWVEAPLELQASMARLNASLQLPSQGNPRARAWAAQLRMEYAAPEQRAKAVLRFFREAGFSYTLNPPPEATRSIDRFLFEQRTGFCSHYAQAMVFVLRASGVPARIVGGYQGGTFNPEGRYWLVRQFDAHAWVEYWIAGQGWVRADPTFEVAPDRIRLGYEQALAQQTARGVDAEGVGAGGRRLAPSVWMRQMRLLWDSLDHQWQLRVLSYQADQQNALLQHSFERLKQYAPWLGLGLMLVLLVGAAGRYWWRWQGEQTDPVLVLLERFERLLAQRGLIREKAEGIRHFARRAALDWPEQAASIQSFAQTFEAVRYGGLDLAQALPDLRRALKALNTGTIKVSAG